MKICQCFGEHNGNHRITADTAQRIKGTAVSEKKRPDNRL